MYIIQFYYETENDLIKDKEEKINDYEEALKRGKAYVKDNPFLAAYISRGEEESRELITGIHSNSITNYIKI